MRAGVARVAAPLLVGHHQRERHVLVGVGRGAAGRRCAPLASMCQFIRPLLSRCAFAYVPQAVERRLVVHVHGEQHPVGDPFRDRVVAVLGALHAQAAARRRRQSSSSCRCSTPSSRRRRCSSSGSRRTTTGGAAGTGSSRRPPALAASAARRSSGVRPARPGRAGRSGRVSASAACPSGHRRARRSRRRRRSRR